MNDMVVLVGININNIIGIIKGYYQMKGIEYTTDSIGV